MGLDPVTALKTAHATIPIVGGLYQWFRARIYPRAPKNSVGFAVAIVTDNTVHPEQIKHDFTETLSSLLKESTPSRPFNLIEVPTPLANKIKTDDDALRVLKKTRCMYLVWGRARLRKIKGQVMYVLDLKSAVAHGQVPKEVSKQFAEEMSQLLPGRYLISKEDELVGFEVSAASLNLTTRYIIGVAALLTGDFQYSQQLFQELARMIQGVRGTIHPALRQPIMILKARLPINRVVVHIAQARRLHDDWRKTRDPLALKQIKAHLDEADDLIPNVYDVLLLRAIYWFVAKRDMKLARAEIAKCARHFPVDPIWRFSQAFLFAYSGKMDDAIRSYKQAFRNAESSTLIEVEEFIGWVVQEEPSKTQLHFCLGLINYLGKGDKQQAKIDFERFVETTKNGSFIGQQIKAKDYLKEINKHS